MLIQIALGLTKLTMEHALHSQHDFEPSDNVTSICEIQKDGLKSISSQIHNIIQCNKSTSYDHLVKTIKNANKNTLKRRIYDVLTVFRALGLISKDKKIYKKTESFDFLSSTCSEVPNNEELNKNSKGLAGMRKILLNKNKLLQNLETTRKSLRFIIERNKFCNISCDKLYTPFVLITTDKSVQVNCETNEERDFFKIQSRSKIKVVDDLTIFKELFEIAHKKNSQIRYGLRFKVMDDDN
ncbi:hypothetical protein EDEG_00332 [Edhazardia aedis USNM 41457]|uniref:E2F/DP family winged-helix DNA-binding domain-containing protein n=1 Tax=Edhazardia aedis (strain USNM 41457) TaxID=1003232 RepID=J9DKI6_EDHAE|nr:hypothetical protein EDEG_00332 [Edhazardia aedis USNM 41457]|eukprot:EJW01902.1 hypothetical protein EDEG_00332 [Edhazardia aedis USNM 41457]